MGRLAVRHFLVRGWSPERIFVERLRVVRRRFVWAGEWLGRSWVLLLDAKARCTGSQQCGETGKRQDLQDAVESLLHRRGVRHDYVS